MSRIEKRVNMQLESQSVFLHLHRRVRYSYALLATYEPWNEPREEIVLSAIRVVIRFLNPVDSARNAKLRDIFAHWTRPAQLIDDRTFFGDTIIKHAEILFVELIAMLVSYPGDTRCWISFLPGRNSFDVSLLSMMYTISDDVRYYANDIG